MSARVAIVARDPKLRILAASAFDDAPKQWCVRLFEQPPAGADAIVVCGDVDVEGILFDPDRPQLVVDEVERELERTPQRRSLLVAGGTGGAGTTTIALHLAASLSRFGSACYFEIDPNRGALPRLGLGPDVPSWADAGEGEEGLLRAAVPVEGSFRVLLRPEEAEGGDLTELVDRCRRTFDHTVLDAGCNPPPAFVNRGILVIPPSIVGARRAASLLGNAPDVAWAVVTNRLGPGSECTVHMLERVMGCKVALELPCAPGMRDLEDESRLFDRPWSRWSRRLHDLASAVAVA